MKLIERFTRIKQLYLIGFKTLKTKGQYEICRVCKWEDDGNREPDSYSSANRKTLSEASKIFNEKRNAHPEEKRYRSFPE